MTTCTTCGIPKEEKEFPCPGADGRKRYLCKGCRKKYNSGYYQRNKEYFKQAQRDRTKANPTASRDYARAQRIRNPNYWKDKERRHPGRHHKAMIKRKYGLSIEQWDKLVLNQGGMCAVCGKDAKLCVDHDHTTNKVRGLLCAPCNQGIGLMKDSSVVTQLATNYLKLHGK